MNDIPDIPDIPDNLSPEEKWVWAASLAVNRDKFLSLVRRLLKESEPYTPSPDEGVPQGPYIPLALRK